MNSILENIDTIRRNRGYSQEYLAMQIGMKQAGFSLIMSGERELKYKGQRIFPVGKLSFKRIA